MNNTEKLAMHTPSLADENFAALAKLFPNAVSETIDENGAVVRAIDKDVLAQEINAYVVEGREERYQFTWPDKRKSILLANAPIAAALRPYREESVDFDTTENLYIEGDNLDVLKLLRETYLNRVKMIYIDPPYNTGKNYIYKNDFVSDGDEYLANSGQYDDEGNRLVTNLETNGQFHTDWLNMIYARLKIAKQLLTNDGVLVVAIDENEQATVSLILKEIFREGGYEQVCVSVVHNPRGIQGLNFSYTHEYAIFVYPKGKKVIADRVIEEEDVDWSQFRNWGTESERTDAKNCFYPVLVKDGEVIGFGEVSPDDYHPQQTEWKDGVAYVYPIDRSGVERKWRYARQSVDAIAKMLRAKSARGGYEIELGKTFGTYKTIWADKRYDANVYGAGIVGELMPGCGFSFPKSLYTVYDAVVAATLNDPNAIVLDFFSGSATTAHAVMQLNSEDGGHRKFIMVQLPENLDKSLEKATGDNKKSLQQSINFLDSLNKPHFLTEIGKERIRRSGAKIKADSPMTTTSLDIGFRVLRLDSSNMKDVYYTPDEFLTMAQKQQNLFDFMDNIKEDRSDEDLLFQVMLDLGIPLSAKITQDNYVFSVDDNYLIACFKQVDTSLVTEIAKKKPYYAVFRDSSFANDSAMVNFEQVFATYSPNTIRRVL